MSDWRERAACRGVPSLMDPPPEQADANLPAALAHCQGCPVTIDCLSWALALGDREDPGGVAGGTTESQRRDLRRVVAGARRPKPTTKRCPRCEQTKPHAEFPRDRAQRNGLGSRCLVCHAAESRERRARLREQQTNQKGNAA